MIIVSACLAGVNCRYDGKRVPSEKIENLYKDGRAIPVCPEMCAGLSAPRKPGEIRCGRVYEADGNDVTENYIRGARIASDIALASKCTIAILKSKSPTCGCGRIYDGSFSGTMTDGDGVFAAMLREKGFTLYTEESFPENIIE